MKKADELVDKMNKHLQQYDDDDLWVNDTENDYKNLVTYQKLNQILFLRHLVKKCDFSET